MHICVMHSGHIALLSFIQPARLIHICVVHSAHIAMLSFIQPAK